MKGLRHWAFFLAVGTPLWAHAFALEWPAACTDGTDCFVQNYVDHDKGGPAQDFTCANLTYPGHDGTDIRLRSLAAMRAGVAVLAPADGTVLRVRDGVADQSIRDANGDTAAGLAAVKGHDCGNGVVIQHAEGYQTMLCHMRQGSIRVVPGQKVAAGDAVGLIGLSGDTEFPHVHLTVLHDGVKIDPYTAAPITHACGVSGAALWASPHPYHASMLLNDGFAGNVPERDAMRDTPLSAATLPADTPVLTYWADIVGFHAGDTMDVRLTAPDGSVLAENHRTFDKPMAQYFFYVGKRNHGALAKGTYTAQLTLMRPAAGAAPVVSTTRVVQVQ